MPLTKVTKSWREINKERKDKRRKHKEVLLDKKLQAEVKVVKQEESPQKPPKISTLSVAIPGSILENAQSEELRTYLAGQIARAVCIFKVDEVIVFDDVGDVGNVKKVSVDDFDGQKVLRQSCVKLGRILQYLECPQYLRKHFFPMHKDLQYAGLLNPLDAPHHLRRDDYSVFREGVVTNKPVKVGKGSPVNIGLLQDVIVDKALMPGIRCTVKLLPEQEGKKLKGIVVSPTAPREAGMYWGYNVRLANSLSQVLSQCPYEKGYDVTIGTSDKGSSIDEFDGIKYKHLLIIFGGLQGLEAALENDVNLKMDEPTLLFDHYLNTLPNQGSRTIRTEEAILVTLAALRTKIRPKYKAQSVPNKSF